MSENTAPLNENTPIAFGTAIRILEQNETMMRVGGIAVPFTDEQNKDYYGTWWDENSYLGARSSEGLGLVDTYVHHGIPLRKGVPELEELAERRLAPSTLRMTPEGLWAETVLDLSDAYERRVGDAVTAKRLYWSSATSPHLFRFDAETGYVRNWPIVEVSLTPTPGTPAKRTQITTLRALIDADPTPLDGVFGESTASAPSGTAADPMATLRAELLGDYIESDMAMGMLCRLWDSLYWRVYGHLNDWQPMTAGGTLDEKLAVIDATVDEFGDIVKKALRGLLTAITSSEDPQASLRSLLESFDIDMLRAGQVLNATNKSHAKGIKEAAATITELAQAMLDSAGVTDDAERSAPNENETPPEKPAMRRLTVEELVAIAKTTVQ